MLQRLRKVIEMNQLLRAFLTITIVLITQTVTEAQTIPLADYHQHLINPETIAALVTPNPNPAGPRFDPISAKDLITLLDQAGIQRALVLSVAYMWANPSLHI